MSYGVQLTIGALLFVVSIILALRGFKTDFEKASEAILMIVAAHIVGIAGLGAMLSLLK